MTFASLVNSLIGVINALIPALIGVALIIFFIGIIRYIYNAGDTSARTRGRALIGWGLVAMFVLMSLWGILEVARTSIFGGSSTATTATTDRVVGP